MAIKFKAIRDSVDKIHHLCGEETGEWLFDLVEQTSSEAIICEVGAFHGYITSILGHACFGSNRKVLSVDHMIGGQCDYTEESECIYLDYINNLKPVWGHIIPFPMKSRDAFKMIELIGMKIELLYLDADHNEQDVFEELCSYDKLIPVGGMMCGDDCLPKDNPASFNKMWESGDIGRFYHQGVSQSVWKFFSSNQRFEVLPDVPGNQFGFRKVA